MGKKIIYSIIVVCLLVAIFGWPGKPIVTAGGDWMWHTNGGYLEVMVWDDYWNYGAMVLRETQKDNATDVTWWLRFEWFKR